MGPRSPDWGSMEPLCKAKSGPGIGFNAQGMRAELESNFRTTSPGFVTWAKIGSSRAENDKFCGSRLRSRLPRAYQGDGLGASRALEYAKILDFVKPLGFRRPGSSRGEGQKARFLEHLRVPPSGPPNATCEAYFLLTCATTEASRSWAFQIYART